MYKRVIIKIGTKVISTEDGKLDLTTLRKLVREIALLRKKGIEIVVVTSGAVAAGRGLLPLRGKNEKAIDKQIFASVGQVRLMNVYSKLFGEQGYLCSQVLVTKEDFRDKTHYSNMKNCFENLLSNNIIPVVNENDVVATSELLFTDNDELAGLIASQLNANAVIILTSVDGVLVNPKDANSKIVSEINFKDIASTQKYITPEKSAFGRGGMLTKFAVAKKLSSQGIVTHIVSGKKKNILADLIGNKPVGTKFLPQGKSPAVKRRIAYSDGLTKGTIYVDKGAENILLSKERIISLLPVGVIKMTGSFVKGDTIEIRNENGKKLGFGLAQYSSVKLKRLMGVKNSKPVIHYNYMFIG